jgi:hypothetical protein
MPTTDTASRLTPYIEELLDNEHARESLRRGATALGAGAKALARGRRKPERRRGRRLVWLLGIVGVGGGLALAANEDLRSSLFGTSSHPGQSPEGS